MWIIDIHVDKHIFIYDTSLAGVQSAVPTVHVSISHLRTCTCPRTSGSRYSRGCHVWPRHRRRRSRGPGLRPPARPAGPGAPGRTQALPRVPALYLPRATCLLTDAVRGSARVGPLSRVAPHQLRPRARVSAAAVVAPHAAPVPSHWS